MHAHGKELIPLPCACTRQRPYAGSTWQLAERENSLPCAVCRAHGEELGFIFFNRPIWGQNPQIDHLLPPLPRPNCRRRRRLPPRRRRGALPSPPSPRSQLQHSAPTAPRTSSPLPFPRSPWVPTSGSAPPTCCRRAAHLLHSAPSGSTSSAAPPPAPALLRLQGRGDQG